MAPTHTRRRFVASLTTIAGASLFCPLRAKAAEEPPETATIRLAKLRSVCNAPVYIAEELLRAEGFTDIRYIEMAAGPPTIAALDGGAIDFHQAGPAIVQAIDGGAAVTLLGGVHIGCYELFVRDDIHGITELKGKTVGLKDAPVALLSLIAAQVGLDPARDIRWVTSAGSSDDPLELFAAGKLDGFLGFSTEPQELRARKIGHVIFDSAKDRPWSQYFCCLLAGNRHFVRKYPIATKRVLLAVLKATDLCATDPTGVARRTVERGFEPNYEYAVRVLRELPYDKWREYDPEDSVRFYALRMHEVGLVKSSPQKIIAQGTDWRFLNELKRELKA